MGILKNILTAVRGGASEVGEAIVDVNAVRILEQEIRDAESAIGKAKQSLTSLKASEIKLKREIHVAQSDIGDYESKAVQALDAGNEALAVEVAERIAELESDTAEKTAEHSSLSAQVNKINSMIRQREKTIQKNSRELEKIKTVEQLQKATSTMSTNFAATNASDHRVSKALDRVKKKQANWEDRMEAGEWMAEEENNDDLDNKLKAAGIGANSSAGASSVLERLKKQSGQ
ncbi:MAG: PspA/IM30 family protein [Gammaproteobacteria bacterium]|nr:PspA/IM30 family protein [Gammaproteobacteria bacterium]MBQ0840393.1 PspA/IM30 family protein [Gammaproteobacteria bacterium]